MDYNGLVFPMTDAELVKDVAHMIEHYDGCGDSYPVIAKRVVAVVAEVERERCATLAEEYYGYCGGSEAPRRHGETIAAAIRAGEKAATEGVS